MWINAAKKVLQHHQFVYVNYKTGAIVNEVHPDGIILDGTTSHMLMTIYNALNDDNKVKFTSLPLNKAVDVGWKLIK